MSSDNEENVTSDVSPNEIIEQTVLSKVPIKRQLKPESKSKRIRIRNSQIQPPIALPLETLEVTPDVAPNPEQLIVGRISAHEEVSIHERLLEFSKRPNITDETVKENKTNKSITIGPPFVCVYCQCWFLVRGKLTVHYVTNHNCEHCNLCNLLFETIREKMHHENKIHFPIECEVCSKSFRDNWLLNEHYENEHDTISCLFCGILIQPKTFYVNHIRRKHVVHDQYFETEEGLKIVDNWDSKWSFRCRLCNKERKKIDLFGHYNMHHKITVSCFIQLLFSENINVNIEGNLDKISNDIVSEALDCSINKYSSDDLTCEICMTKDNKIIPPEFHKLYCAKEIGCKHCLNTFKDEDSCDLHIEKMHRNFKCSLGCSQVSFSNETQLQSHYNKFHDIVPCRYCDIFVSAANDKYEHHLKTQHNYKPVIMKKLSNVSLFQCIKRDDKNLVICCMCDKSLTEWVNNIEAMYLHYAQDHFVTMKSIFSLISSNPLPVESISRTDLNSDSSMNAPCNQTLESIDDADKQSSEEDKDESKTNECVDVKQEVETDSEQENEEDIDDATEALSDMDPLEVQCFVDDTSNDEQSENELETDPELVKIKNEPTDDSDNGYEYENCESGKKLQRERPLFHLKKDCGDRKFTCDMCEEKITTKRELLEHSNSIHGFVAKVGPLTCVECPETFSSESIYERHTINIHGREIILNENCERTHTCSFCNFTGSKKSTRLHIREEHTSDIEEGRANRILGFKCRYCDECFWKTETRNSHEIQNHSDKYLSDFFKCFVCYEVYSSKICLKRHVHSRHTLEPKYRSQSVSYKCLKCLVLLPGLDETRSHFAMQHPTLKILRCAIKGCNARLKTKKTFTMHVKNVHTKKRKNPFGGPSSCELCGKWLSNSRSATTHYRMKHGQETKVGYGCRLCKLRFDSIEKRKLHYATTHSGTAAYECPECGKGFNSKSGLYGHKQLHMNNSFECQYCKKSFVRRDTYNEHLLIHSGPRHQCPFCPRSFTQRSNLTRHTRIHTGQKPYKCTWCPKRFSDKGACNSHIRVHTREEESQCPYCNKTFSKKQKLNYHIRKHTGEGLLPCPTCGKQFTNSFSLKEHRVIHETSTQLLCGQCGRGFSHERYLRRHMLAMHTANGRRYSCPLCEKKFVAQNQLNIHVMTHTGIKHIQCLLCEMAYASRKSIIRHLIQAHNITPSKDVESYSKYFHQMSAEEAGLVIPGQEDNEYSDDESPTMVPLTTSINLAEALKLTEFKNFLVGNNLSSLQNIKPNKLLIKPSNKITSPKKQKKGKKKKDISEVDEEVDKKKVKNKNAKKTIDEGKEKKGETKRQIIKKPKRYEDELSDFDEVNFEQKQIETKSRKIRKPKRFCYEFDESFSSKRKYTENSVELMADIQIKSEPEDEYSDAKEY